MTNLDRFRTKSAAEIAKFLSYSCDCPDNQRFPDDCPMYGSCRDCWEEWLNEEAEEEDG